MKSRLWRFEPWKHQIESYKFGIDNPHAMYDMSDPGTGKTSVQLMILADEYSRGKDRRTLIVCPKTLVRPAWANEIERFFPQLTYSLALAPQRKEAFALDTQIVITNTDAVKDLTKEPKLLNGFDTMIVDESTVFKHGTSQRSKAAYQISKRMDNVRELTGTPNSNSVTELWHQMLILDGGQRLGNNFFRFRNSVQTSKQVGPNANMVKWEDKDGALEAVYSLIDDVTIRHGFEEVMTHVPPNHVSKLTFPLSPKARKIYNEFAKNMVAEIGDRQISSVHAATLRQKLLQIASGAVYSGEKDRDYALVDGYRYELAADLIEERDHSIAFFNWYHQRVEMEKHLLARKISYAVIDGTVKSEDRDAIVARFQAGDLQHVMLHPETGAHGLTLTMGEACMLLSPFYRADWMKQGIHRIYRGAQDKVTNTLLLEAEDTCEELVYDVLDGKMHNMREFLDLAVQSRRRRQS